VSRGATLDDRYRARPQVVRIWLGHPTILPKGIRGARLAHPQTFGNPPDSRPVGYALAHGLILPTNQHHIGIVNVGWACITLAARTPAS
jgi:hypothetical protein